MAIKIDESALSRFAVIQQFIFLAYGTVSWSTFPAPPESRFYSAVYIRAARRPVRARQEADPEAEQPTSVDLV